MERKRKKEDSLQHLIQTKPEAQEIFGWTDLLPVHHVGKASYERFYDPQTGVRAYRGQGALSHDSRIAMTILQDTKNLFPSGWSVVIRNGKSEKKSRSSEFEFSFGYWWPSTLRPFNYLLPVTPTRIMHMFAGSNDMGTATMTVRWLQSIIQVHFHLLDRTDEYFDLTQEQLDAGMLEERIIALLGRGLLIPGR
jgi:hypothetical protein